MAPARRRPSRVLIVSAGQNSMPRSNFDDTYSTSNAQAMMSWWYRYYTPLLFHFYKVHELDLPELYRRGYRIPTWHAHGDVPEQYQPFHLCPAYTFAGNRDNATVPRRPLPTARSSPVHDLGRIPYNEGTMPDLLIGLRLDVITWHPLDEHWCLTTSPSLCASLHVQMAHGIMTRLSPDTRSTTVTCERVFNLRYFNHWLTPAATLPMVAPCTARHS